MKTSLYLCMAVLLLTACSKKDGGGGTTPSVTAKTKTQLLTQKEWVLTSSTYRADSAPNWTDDFSNKAACVKDDHFVFKTDGVWQHTEGATKCSPNDPFIYETSAWSFVQGETQLKLGSRTYTIDVLDETTLSLSLAYTSFGIPSHAKETYGH